MVSGEKNFRKRLKGYTSVFLVIIVLSVVMTCLVMVEVSAGFAARSIGENVCAVAGRSVLSEFQKDLFRRYRLFAVRKSEYFLQSKASFYINGSLEAERGLVRIQADCITVDTSEYEFDTEELLRQINQVPGSGLDMYIINNFSNTVSSREDTYRTAETEYMIYGKKSDELNQDAAKHEISLMLFFQHMTDIYNDAEKLLLWEEEALLTNPEFPPELTIAARAAEESWAYASNSIDQILSGECVPLTIFPGFSGKGEYEDYLRFLLLKESKNEKLQRMMTVMEENIIYVDKADFSFTDYVFGFDLKVDFSKNASAQMLGITKRKGSVTQSFSYQ